jgi:hypothetical protein
MQHRFIHLFIAMLLITEIAKAQTAEVYAGHQRTGLDIMWFKNFRNKKEERIPFLFFKNGLAITAVGSFLQNGFTLKSGIQYYRQKGNFMFFGWLVADLKKEGNIDVFGMFRYHPKIKSTTHAFGQLEIFPVYTPSTDVWNLTQRVRLGLKRRSLASGFMADFNQTGKSNFTTTHNLGIFLRNEF